MTTPDILVLLRRHGRVLPLLLILGILTGGAIFLIQPRTYEASSTIFISTTTGEEVADLQMATSVSEQRAITYAELVNSPAVLDPVLNQLDLQLSSAALGEQLQAQVVPGTSLLQITAESVSPEHAAQLVDAAAASLSELSGSLEELEGAPQGLVTLSVLDTVSVPDRPAGPGLPVYLGLGAAGGLIAGIGWVLLRHSLDTRIHSAAEVAALTDLPVATAPQYSRRLRRSHAAAQRRAAFTALQAQLRPANDDPGHALLMTSPVSGQETTAAALDLAAASISAGRRTLVVDADSRHSLLTRRLDLSSRPGLSDVLAGSTTPGQAMVHHRGSFDVLPAGRTQLHHESPAQWEQLITHLSSGYELTIVNVPPVLPGAETLVAGRLVSGTLVVARAGCTDRAQLITAVERLRSSGAATLGVLLIQPSSGPDAYQPGRFGWMPAHREQVGA